MATTAAACCCLLLASCNSTKTVSVNGTVLDASMNTLMIVTEDSDTLSFSTVDADRSGLDGLFIGNAVQVEYEGRYSPGMPASRLSNPSGNDGEQTSGDLIESSYEGILPAADCPGIRYSLTVRSAEHSGDGRFTLEMTYLEAEDGKDVTFTIEGDRFTQRGTPDDNDAVVWQLVPDDASEGRYNLLCEDGGERLTMLDADFRRIDSELNYTLEKTR